MKPLFDQLRQPNFICVFHLGEIRAKRRIISQLTQALQLIQLFQPIFSYVLGNEFRQTRIRLIQPTPWRNTIRDVHDLVRP